MADAEAGFGGALNCFELMKVGRLCLLLLSSFAPAKYFPVISLLIGFGHSNERDELCTSSWLTIRIQSVAFQAYIEAGAAGVHYEDQLGSEKKCGHMGGKVNNFNDQINVVLR